MKNLYLDAAKLVCDGEFNYCCTAILKSEVDPLNVPFYHKFADYFEPEGSPVVWFNNRTERTLALLLMHEIARDGGLY